MTDSILNYVILFSKRKNAIEYFKETDFSTFMLKVLNFAKLEFKQNENGHFYIPSKNSTIIYKRMDSAFIKKVEDEIWVWEDLWISKNEIVANKIFAHLGILKSIPARVCKATRVDKIRAESFLNEHHLQGYVYAKIKYGLFLSPQYQRLIDVVIPEDGLLIAVMTFSGKRKFRDGSSSYEMIRFGGLKNFRIMGGFSKILHSFINDNKPDHLMTYIDRDWSEGENLKKFGFAQTNVLDSLFFDLNENMNRTKTLQENKFRAYSAGSIKMEWTKK